MRSGADRFNERGRGRGGGDITWGDPGTWISPFPGVPTARTGDCGRFFSDEEHFSIPTAFPFPAAVCPL